VGLSWRLPPVLEVKVSVKDKPKRNSGHAYRSIGDEGGLVVIPRQSKVQVLNPVGIKVYSMLDGTHNRDEIVHAVMDEFDVTETVARSDVDAFLDELASEGMLASTDGTAEPHSE
jgi:hypothetical protein